jgi:hypothetical protein
LELLNKLNFQKRARTKFLWELYLHNYFASSSQATDFFDVGLAKTFPLAAIPVSIKHWWPYV